MSGVPDFTGRHAERMEGHGPDAARGRHGEARAATDGLSHGGWLCGRPARLVAAMRGRCGGIGRACKVESRRGECLDSIRQWLTIQL